MSRRISLRSIFFETRIIEKITLGSSGFAMPKKWAERRFEVNDPDDPPPASAYFSRPG
jgi:hypothetical protein